MSHVVDGSTGSGSRCLQTGLEQGYFWHRRVLADPDLDAARRLRGWQEFENRSSERVESTTMERPKPFVRSATTPQGTVVALHGAGQVPDDFKTEWVDEIPDDWSVVAPVGDVPLSDVSWAWPYDLDTCSLSEALVDVDLEATVVLLGFSQGAGIAARAAWNGVVPSVGLLLSAATLPLDMWSGSDKRPIPLYAVVGTEDGAYSRCTAIAGELQADGVPVYLDVREGLGHRPPEDLANVIRAGIDWILSQRADIP